MAPRFIPTTIIDFVNPPDNTEIETRLKKIKSEHAVRKGRWRTRRKLETWRGRNRRTETINGDPRGA